VRWSRSIRNSNAIRLASLPLVLSLFIAMYAQPADAQTVVVEPSCNAGVGSISVVITGGGTTAYSVHLDNKIIAGPVTSSNNAIVIAPVVDGTRTVRIDVFGGQTVVTRTIVVQCTSVAVTPKGGVATGGGGTAPGSSEPGIPWLAALGGLLAGLVGVQIVRGRFAAQ